MKHEFMLSDLDDKMDELDLGQYGRDYTMAVEQDGEEYYVDQFAYWCPELNLSFREGAAASQDSDDFEYDIVAVYDGSTDGVEDVEKIYSNCTLSEIVLMIAAQRIIDSDTIRFVLDIPDSIC